MILKDWLTQATQDLQAIGIGSAALDAQLLTCHVLVKDKAFLIANPDFPLTDLQQESLNALLHRRLNNEPIAYILESKEFYGLNFKIDKRALIPRWESETIIECAVSWLQNRAKGQIVAEIGTGAGAIITALAKTVPGHTFMATELDADALKLAGENIAKHGLSEQVALYQGDLTAPLLPKFENQVNLLIANMPYIPSPLLVSLDPTVQYHEPHLALDGGDDDGLRIYRDFMLQAPKLLASDGLLLCEHEFDQGEAMRNLAQIAFPDAQIKTLQDGLSHDRVLACQL